MPRIANSKTIFRHLPVINSRNYFSCKYRYRYLPVLSSPLLLLPTSGTSKFFLSSVNSYLNSRTLSSKSSSINFKTNKINKSSAMPGLADYQPFKELREEAKKEIAAKSYDKAVELYSRCIGKAERVYIL